jgi:hypothetical protein
MIILYLTQTNNWKTSLALADKRGSFYKQDTFSSAGSEPAQQYFFFFPFSVTVV